MQSTQQLADRIARLTPAEQSVVETLLDTLESKKPVMTLDQAIDEIEREHPELLRLLAQ